MSPNEEALRARLAQLDIEREQAMAQASAETAAAETAQASAGDEYDGEIAGAQDDFAAAQSDYDDFLNATSQSLTGAQAAIDAIDTTPATIDAVDAIVIATGGVPDCAAADIQAAVNGAIAQINDILAELLTRVNSDNVQHVKDAMGKLKDVGQGFRDQMPGADDTEALKATALAALDALY
jgi:hypothetical protein